MTSRRSVPPAPGKKDTPSPPHLTIGSNYRILSLGSRDEMIKTEGTFLGIVSVGTIDGIALNLAAVHGDMSGKVRVIPSHMILAIDILEQAAAPEDSPEEAHMHYT